MVKVLDFEPYFACEHCQKPITQCGEAIVLAHDWQFKDAGVLTLHEICEAVTALEPDPAPVSYLHNSCLDAYEVAHNLQGKTSWDHLQNHLIKLLNSTDFFAKYLPKP